MYERIILAYNMLNKWPQFDLMRINFVMLWYATPYSPPHTSIWIKYKFIRNVTALKRIKIYWEEALLSNEMECQAWRIHTKTLKFSPLYMHSHIKLVQFNDYFVIVDCEIHKNECVLSETSSAHLHTKILDLLYPASISLFLSSILGGILYKTSSLCRHYRIIYIFSVDAFVTWKWIFRKSKTGRTGSSLRVITIVGIDKMQS